MMRTVAGAKTRARTACCEVQYRRLCRQPLVGGTGKPVWIASLSLFCSSNGVAACFVGNILGGYWENRKAAINPGSADVGDAAYYANDLQSFNAVYCSFLMLEQQTDPYSRPDQQWDGWAIMDEGPAKGKKFVRAIGEWTDLGQTVSDDQVPTQAGGGCGGKGGYH